MKETLMKKNERGITLVALIITIVVLIILCGITISATLGDKGIVDRSKQFANQTNSTIEGSMSELNGLMQEYDETMNGKKVQSLIGKEAASINQTVVDNFQNRIEIPAGFTVVANGTDNVTYTYEKDEQGNPTGNPTVQDGIVIKDNDGNEFVWVPVGDIKNNDGTTTTITLGRYVFDENGNADSPSQSATDYQNEVVLLSPSAGGNIGYVEVEESTYGNATASNLGEWINKALEKGGYYIARYEAGQKTIGTTKIATSKPGTPWNYLSQVEAAEAATKMYPNNTDENVLYYSDLVNSYAWDTAIVFIQKYADSDYSIQTSKNTSLESTGERTSTTTDKVCNIYDMASNAMEYSTETFKSSSVSGVGRGGLYDATSYKASARGSGNPSERHSKDSFRVVLCVK